jgi:hypothetical protein
VEEAEEIPFQTLEGDERFIDYPVPDELAWELVNDWNRQSQVFCNGQFVYWVV